MHATLQIGSACWHATMHCPHLQNLVDNDVFLFTGQLRHIHLLNTFPVLCWDQQLAGVQPSDAIFPKTFQFLVFSPLSPLWVCVLLLPLALRSSDCRISSCSARWMLSALVLVRTCDVDEHFWPSASLPAMSDMLTKAAEPQLESVNGCGSTQASQERDTSSRV